MAVNSLWHFYSFKKCWNNFSGLESVRSNRFAYDFVGKYMLCMFVQGIIFFCLTLAIEIRLWSSIKHHLFNFWTNRFRSSIGGLTGLKDDDEDVAVERRRVLESSTIDDVLVRINDKKTSRIFSQDSYELFPREAWNFPIVILYTSCLAKDENVPSLTKNCLCCELCNNLPSQLRNPNK